MPDDKKPAAAPTEADGAPADGNTPVRPVGRQGRFDPIPPDSQDQVGKKRIGG